MKLHATLFATLMAVAVGVLCRAADSPKKLAVYSPAEAAKHIGETATVEGVVSSTRELASKQVFLNFGAPFPNHDFTAVVFAKDRTNFGDLLGLRGKSVRVSGKIEDYRGKPEIKLVSADQLVVAK
jgi:DNA/RNA endonuclease YhcR with UshA esterase domain